MPQAYVCRGATCVTADVASAGTAVWPLAAGCGAEADVASIARPRPLLEDDTAEDDAGFRTRIPLDYAMYPIMVQIDFSEVVEAVKAPKPVLTTLVINWAIKPFTMLFFATVFMRYIWAPFIPQDMATSYIAGMILLGIAPCTAMVLVWSYLADGFMGHTLVMVAINSLTMLVLYAPLGSFLLGASNIRVPFLTLFYTILFYVGVALVAGFITRTQLIKRKGLDWYESVFLRYTGQVSVTALLLTLVFLFMLQGHVIVERPLVILMIAIPLFIQTMFIFILGYWAS
ncbi:MAG: hypothetical protein AB1563_03045, partial [Bacillota bacterium]